MTLLVTPRLRLEPLEDRHFAGLHELNRDPVVMRYITGRPDTPDDTRSMIERVKVRWAELGYSWWGFIRQEDGQLIGTGCIQHLNRDPAGPLETGWRLRQDVWGQGYASEAARQSEQPYLPEIVEPMPLEQVLALAPAGAARLALTERSGEPFAIAPEVPSLWLVVGPEGGLSSRDHEILSHSKFVPTSLGRAILRTETAAVVGVAVGLNHLGGRR